MKAHIGVDARSGLVHTVGVTSGSVHDVTVMEHLIRDDDSVLPLAHASACRNLRTSQTLRIDDLSAGIGPPLAWPQRDKGRPRPRFDRRQREL